MITSQHEKIISGLERATSDGKILWEPTGLQNEFFTNVGDYRIKIYKIEEDGAYSIILSDTVCAEMSFIDEHGSTFDRIVVNTVSGNEYQRISKLHDLAKRSASGADKKLNDIISILQK